jgi:GNAT superfamily N-acetyltransferase
LIRRKCETGIKESFLIEYCGQICGSIGAIRMADLLRLKNIIIRPGFRRQGLGLQAVRELAALAHSRGLPALGVFGIEGDAGDRLYRSAGFSVIGDLTEWCKRLDSPQSCS